MPRYMEKQGILDNMKELSKLKKELDKSIKKLEKVVPMTHYEYEVLKVLNCVSKQQTILNETLERVLHHIIKYDE